MVRDTSTGDALGDVQQQLRLDVALTFGSVHNR